jgi:hypothetical protein
MAMMAPQDKTNEGLPHNEAGHAAMCRIDCDAGECKVRAAKDYLSGGRSEKGGRAHPTIKSGI